MVKVITAPTVEPVTVAEFSSWMQGLTITPDQTAQVNLLLKAGREESEKYQNAAYCTQTLQIAPDNLSGAIVLPRPPFQLLTSVIAYFSDGTNADITTNCTVNDIAWPVEITLPTISGTLRDVNPVVITYVAGSNTVPERVRQAILLYATWSWMHRGGDTTIPDAFYALLSKGRRIPV